MKTSREIRQQFIDFFRQRGHEIDDCRSSPVVPHDDPTLMFANAGMNQFKPYFLGTETPKYLRAANTQKCIRAGGKHNDLDDVGQDTYHHTFFEMLGNWSFGDYFKEDAIRWAWELLTEVWSIDKDRLHATYFEGDADEGLEPDDETAKLWRSVTDIDPKNIHPGNKKDNFWEMGDVGPCGPCSEIHVDLTPDKTGRSLVNAGQPDVIELWNLVFIQFNASWKPGGKEAVLAFQKIKPLDGFQGEINEGRRIAREEQFSTADRGVFVARHRKLTPLPAKHVDTGMGFERLCAILSGKKSNYDTDIFAPLFTAIQHRCHAPDYAGTLPEPRDSSRAAATDSSASQVFTDITYRVIADHLRCLVFALTDGAVPSNEGRGYVLRRILRRAVRYGRQYFNMQEPFLCDLVPTVVEQFADTFPELRNAHAGNNATHVAELLRDEERSFGRTLERGLTLFEIAARDALGRAIAIDNDTVYTLSTAEGEGSFAPDAPGRWRLNFKDGPQVVVGQITREEVLEHTQQVPRISGEAAFDLHDTFGFPIDLTEQIAEERGLKVDIGEYERMMEQARETAKRSRRDLDDPFEEETYRILLTGQSCDDSLKYQEPFECRAFLTVMARTTKLGDTDSATKGQSIVFSTNRTPFYAEQGGQVSDIGTLDTDSEGIVDVSSVVRRGDHVLHRGIVRSGTISPGLKVWLRVDRHRRAGTMQNHTATHILNWALREVLGERVQQEGSLVDPDKTRFDFSHNKPVTPDELNRIEDLVNERIETNHVVYTKEVDQKKALKINTLRAVFGEKYPDRVRVVSIGADIDEMLNDPKNPKWMNYSVEFCGGTHLKKTSQAQHFVLTTEEAVAKGIRRVVGITGKAARAAEQTGRDLLDRVESLTNLASAEPPNRDAPLSAPEEEARRKRADDDPVDIARKLSEVQSALSEATIPLRIAAQIRDKIAELQQLARNQSKKQAASAAGDVLASAKSLLDDAPTVGQTRIIVGQVPHAAPDALRGAIDWFRQKTESSAVLLACHDDKKVTLLAGMSKDLVKRGIKAGDLIKEIAPLVGGKGGGRPDMAQGGGNDPAAVPAALKRALEWIKSELS